VRARSTRIGGLRSGPLGGGELFEVTEILRYNELHGREATVALEPQSLGFARTIRRNIRPAVGYPGDRTQFQRRDEEASMGFETPLFPRPLFAVVVIWLGAGCAGPEAPADTIYWNADVVTVNDAQPTAEAVAVRDGLIVAVGAPADVMDLRGESTLVQDLQGRTLVPGFIDGHAHFGGFGAQAVGGNLLASPDGTANTIDDLVRALREYPERDELERTGWIYGMGYDNAVLAERRHPTRDDLDRVSTEIPVMAVHISGHIVAVNSAGLHAIGYSADTEDPPGGVIRRRPGSREPNGVLEELAGIPVMFGVLSPSDPEAQAFFIGRGLEIAKSFGHTTVQEGRANAAAHQSLARAALDGAFDIDVVSYIDYASREVITDEWHGRDYRSRYRIGGIKVTLDGSPQGRTAWRTAPYLLPPEGQEEGYLGYPAIPDDEVVVSLFEEAYANGWQVLTHTNGDAAIDQLIRVVATVQRERDPSGRRDVLIHGQFLREDQLDSLVALDLMPSLFPMHTFYWGDWYDEIVGPEQAQQISPMRSALDRGLIATSHSDAPVALPNLMRVMAATVNRTSRSGKVMGERERLTPEEALKAITLWGAYQHFEEDRKGSIEVGKLADLVVLSDNPLTVDPAAIGDIVVLETIKEGRSVYRVN
jgi:predicted amidohydrolase YtcJ